jgi:cytidylate kinase
MSARVVCISRAICGGAEEVAAGIAKELGFRCIDEEIVVRAAELQGLDPAEVADVERRKSFLGRLLEDIAVGSAYRMAAYVPDGGAVPMSMLDLRSLIRKAIAEAASEGSVVIVAHGASYALRERDDVLRVLVTGSPAVRAGRLAVLERRDSASAQDAIAESDSARADYLERFYEVEQELAEHYDITVSTDVLTPAQAAELITRAARMKGG